MPRSRIGRRRFLQSAAAAAVAAPYVRGVHAAGRLALGLWDHWVPDANNEMTKICHEWGEKNHVDIQIDFITSIGNKDLLTGSAEAQARTGHDILTHRSWQINVHRRLLEPVNDVVAALEKEYGPIEPTVAYLAKHDGQWHGLVSAGSPALPPCSRIDLFKQHCGIDLVKMFPASEQGRDKALIDTWTWDTYLDCAQKLHKAGYPVGLPMATTADAMNWVGALFRAYGAIMIDEKDQIRIDSPETRTVLEYAKKLMAVNPPEVYAWDDAGNNRWLISGKGSSIFNPPSAWAVAKRDAPKVAEQLWTHDMPKGPKGRFEPYYPYFYGIWSFSQNKGAAKELVKHLCGRPQAQRLDNAASGYDLPGFPSFYDFDVWKNVEPPKGTVYNYPLRDDEEYTIAGYPARPDVASQIFNQGLQTTLIAKVTQGGESIDEAIKWAAGELESYLRT